MSTIAKAEFKISYFFRKGPKGAPGLVYIKSKQNSDRQTVFNTGLKLVKEQWDKKKHRPKVLPARLMELEAKLKGTYASLLEEGRTPDLKMLLARMDDPKRPKGRKILDWCTDYITGQYSDGQKKAVSTLKSNLEGFNREITFDRLTRPILKDFFDHLTTQGVANNSQYKRLRALINVANHANIQAPELSAYALPYSTVNALTVRLNWQEVKAIMGTETTTAIEQVAKDVFLLACFSGLRIADILKLEDGEMHASYYERMQIKTRKPVYVTLHKYNEALFRKYMGGVSYSRQRLSDALDSVLDRSGLTKKVTITRAVGHKHVTETGPKFKYIAFHSGRRFYSRLLNDLGLGGEIARDELGHSFKSVTELYAGSPEHALRISRVRTAMEGMEKSMKQLSALMKVA